MLPVDKDWVDYLKRSVDPGLVAPVFSGNWPPPLPDREDALRTHLAALADLGVRYIVTRSGADLFTRKQEGVQPNLVFRDPVASIYELPDAKPYFSAGSAACQVTPWSRRVVQVRCAKPDTLVRRELFYPGWQAAARNGAPLAVTREGLFEAVKLSAGEQIVVFSYRPTHFGLALALASLGLVCASLAAIL